MCLYIYIYIYIYIYTYIFICMYNIICTYIGAGGSTVHDVTGQSVTWAGTRSQKSVYSVPTEGVFIESVLKSLELVCTLSKVSIHCADT
jgi:hypothetical protein